MPNVTAMGNAVRDNILTVAIYTSAGQTLKGYDRSLQFRAGNSLWS